MISSDLLDLAPVNVIRASFRRTGKAAVTHDHVSRPSSRSSQSLTSLGSIEDRNNLEYDLTTLAFCTYCCSRNIWSYPFFGEAWDVINVRSVRVEHPPLSTVQESLTCCRRNLTISVQSLRVRNEECSTVRSSRRSLTSSRVVLARPAHRRDPMVVTSSGITKKAR